MVGFKYKVALARRPARDNKLEPFFYSRDVAHTTKAGSRALCSSSFTLVFGETIVCHHHTLDKGIDPRSYYMHRMQSDKQCANRLAACNFTADPASRHWSETGHLLYTFLLRLGMAAWWSEKMDTMEKFICSAIPFHFLEGVRMLQRSSQQRQQFFQGPTYKAIRRTIAHMMLRCLIEFLQGGELSRNFSVFA